MKYILDFRRIVVFQEAGFNAENRELMKLLISSISG